MLRESYLGPEVASHLFVHETASALNMFESNAGENNTEFSVEEKAKKSTE